MYLIIAVLFVFMQVLALAGGRYLHLPEVIMSFTILEAVLVFVPNLIFLLLASKLEPAAESANNKR